MSGSHIPLVLNLLRSFNPKFMFFCSVRNSEGIVNRVVSICSDITAALLALKSYAVSSKVVLQCRDSLQELALSNRVILVWVPGHCGIYGMRRPTHLQEREQVLILWDRSLVFRWHLQVSRRGSGSG
jgi:hypothetical protein